MPLLRRLVAALAVLATVPLAAQDPPKSISKFDRGASLTMLTYVERDLRDNYYDKTFRGMNVDAVFDEAGQRIRAAGSVNETITIISDALLRLNDSHTMFLPPERKTRVNYGWRATMIGDEPYVVSVDKGSDAEKKGLAPGDRVLFWNRFEPNRRNLWQIEYLYHFIRPQSMQRIIVRKPDGAEEPIDVESTVQLRPRMDIAAR